MMRSEKIEELRKELVTGKKRGDKIYCNIENNFSIDSIEKNILRIQGESEERTKNLKILRELEKIAPGIVFKADSPWEDEVTRIEDSGKVRVNYSSYSYAEDLAWQAMKEVAVETATPLNEPELLEAQKKIWKKLGWESQLERVIAFLEGLLMDLKKRKEYLEEEI